MEFYIFAIYYKRLVIRRWRAFCKEAYHLTIFCHVFRIPCEGNILESVNCQYVTGIFLK